MSCAVKITGMPSIFFINEPPDDQEGLEIEDGAWVEVPMNVSLWPEGARRPEQVLCRSKQDPLYYKLFKYRNEIEDSDWAVTGMNFGGTFSRHSWRNFASRLGAIRALQAIPDDEVGV